MMNIRTETVSRVNEKTNTNQLSRLLGDTHTLRKYDIVGGIRPQQNVVYVVLFKPQKRYLCLCVSEAIRYHFRQDVLTIPMFLLLFI